MSERFIMSYGGNNLLVIYDKETEEVYEDYKEVVKLLNKLDCKCKCLEEDLDKFPVKIRELWID